MLELGGGDGYQAQYLADWGCAVSSIDIAPPSGEKRHFQVEIYDGRHIPFDDDEFDVIFSSNVLEHVLDLSDFLAETRRVLKHDGIAVHVLPTSVWRAVTHAERYVVWLLQRSRPTRKSGAASVEPALTLAGKGGLTGFARRAVFGEPHGEYPTALAELYYYSAYRWTRLFRTNGFDIVNVDGGPLLYSGFGLFPVVRIGAKGRIVRRLVSSTQILVVRRAGSERWLEPT